MRKRKHKLVPHVDSAWFYSQIEKKGTTLRALARVLEVSFPAATHILKGDRRVKMEEVPKIAQFFEVPVNEVLERFGVISVSEQAHTANRTLSIESWLDENHELHTASEGEGVRGKKTVTAPFYETGIKVAKIQASSELGGFDGALVFYQLSKRKGADPELLGSLSLIKVAQHPRLKLRVARRGYTATKYNLVGVSGKVMEEDQKIEAMHPVTWLKI